VPALLSLRTLPPNMADRGRKHTIPALRPVSRCTPTHVPADPQWRVTPPRSFVNQSTVVWRRYSDFEWLRSRLHLFNAGVIVPPIPEKTVLAFDDPQHSVVVERTFLLQWFLQQVALPPRSPQRQNQHRTRLMRGWRRGWLVQVAAHPVLGESLELRLFIESTSTELKEWYERGYIGEAITGASTMFGALALHPPSRPFHSTERCNASQRSFQTPRGLSSHAPSGCPSYTKRRSRFRYAAHLSLSSSVRSDVSAP
jgi:hypothetical protein